MLREGKLSKELRIAVVVSHPIQHFCPQYRSFSEEEGLRLRVFFASALGYRSYMDAQFGKEVKWNNLYLESFDHVFLNGDTIIAADQSIDAPGLEKALTSFQPDLVITYGYFQKLQRRARRWALKNNVKLAYISDSELRHHRNSLKELLKAYFLRNYFSGIDYFLTVGDANEAFYKHYAVHPSKFIRMHFPIDIRQYEEAFPKRELLRKEIRAGFEIDETQLVLSVVGKLVPWKNQDHIIDAMALLEEQGVFIHLFVIGSGEMLEQWRSKAGKLSKSFVHFTGFQNAEALPAYYAATDVYVHPASVEPHSIAISEAIYMGCPVIISDRCGSYGEDDDVQEGRNGMVYPFAGIKSLSEKIRLLATDEEKRKRFSAYSISISRRFQNTAHHGVLQKLKDKCGVV
jgi:glycosyltransferase involved in cell wall biosynthesis